MTDPLKPPPHSRIPTVTEVMHSHHISFLHACDGIRTAVSSRPNFRVHLILSGLALAGAVFFRVSGAEWAIILLTIAIGLVVEMINTSIEFVVDLLRDEYHLLAKYAKDTAAGAMLIYAGFALLVAAVIFLPKIFD